MRILIIEPDAGGHHFLPYLQYFILAAQAKGISVGLMTTADAVAHPAMAVLEATLTCPIFVCLMPSVPEMRSGTTFALLARQRKAYQAVSHGFNILSPVEKFDHIVLMCMDGFDRWFALFGSPFGKIPYSGLYIGLKFHLGRLGIAPSGRLARIHEWLFDRLLNQNTLYAAACIDENLLTYYQNNPNALRKLRYVPDPGELHLTQSTQSSRAELGISQGKFVLLAYGSIDMRKNIALLIQCAAALPEVYLVLAGRMQADVASFCAESPFAKTLQIEGRMLRIDQFVLPVLEATLFAAADCIWLCYSPDFFGQSAVLAQAASAAKPILARRSGQIGATTLRHQLGLTAAPDDACEITAELKRLIENPGLLQQFAKNASEFAPSRSQAAFGAAMLRCLPESAAKT